MPSKSTCPDYVLPAEWEPQCGIQLTWPHDKTDWKPYLDEITNTYVELTRAIAKHEKVIIATPHASDVKALIENCLDKQLIPNIHIYPCPTNDTWARDHGGITLVPRSKAEKGRQRHRVLDFRFNGWGKKFAHENDNLISSRLFAHKDFDVTIDSHNDFVLEGGSIESDGNGTIMTTSMCLLAPNRNQPLTRQEIELQLMLRLHAERIVWLEHGNLIGDDTDGHIDTIVRFAPNDTLVYVGCDDEQDEQFEDFKALEQQLKTLRTMDGKPYRLIKLPMPDAIFDDGDRLPATYANFVIINEAVIVPTYRQPQKDAEAVAAIRQAFPGRETIGIDASAVVRQHGSLHCITMQYPEGTF